ncbi:TPA: hypothetical protein DD449_04250 [Candidatus Berkelbacteria bacterium]|uniref:Uncharacterized protein n=1 Tax=Berkelbacteria bacterium GW2011_GWE1_39_12 TaxID=1618337 RepID=A0A0G4B3Z6_9BACT|nr:MAG: hypothetical protein UT28_C0001G0470 [Berkelbacteria bacterium GW2011_GWE1_39_12]HBO60866.1 hypothetical protein [Candidatus Berkelbacteria bacterium]
MREVVAIEIGVTGFGKISLSRPRVIKADFQVLLNELGGGRRWSQAAILSENTDLDVAMWYVIGANMTELSDEPEIQKAIEEGNPICIGFPGEDFYFVFPIKEEG